MLALVLWYLLGWKVGVLEVFAELAIGLLIYGGGRRARLSFDFLASALRGRVPEPA